MDPLTGGPHTELETWPLRASFGPNSELLDCLGRAENWLQGREGHEQNEPADGEGGDRLQNRQYAADLVFILLLVRVRQLIHDPGQGVAFLSDRHELNEHLGKY